VTTDAKPEENIVVICFHIVRLTLCLIGCLLYWAILIAFDVE
jgi:hypothetical protein